MSKTMVRKTYAVEVERDGRFWLVTVPEIDRVTQARNLAEVDEMATDLIALMTDTEPDSFALAVEIRTPGDAAQHLKSADELRDLAADANRRSAEEVRAAAGSLKDAGLTLRDIGVVLGVSYQRAHQLVGVRAASASTTAHAPKVTGSAGR